MIRDVLDGASHLDEVGIAVIAFACGWIGLGYRMASCEVLANHNQALGIAMKLMVVHL